MKQNNTALRLWTLFLDPLKVKRVFFPKQPARVKNHPYFTTIKVSYLLFDGKKWCVVWGCQWSIFSWLTVAFLEVPLKKPRLLWCFLSNFRILYVFATSKEARRARCRCWHNVITVILKHSGLFQVKVGFFGNNDDELFTWEVYPFWRSNTLQPPW